MAAQAPTTQLPRNVAPNIGTVREQNKFHKKHGEHLKAQEYCLGKYCWQAPAWVPIVGHQCARDVTPKALCDHTFSEWMQGCARWESRLEIREVLSMGYGLYSKWKWKKNDIIGPYLGELIPETSDNTAYCHEVSIGPMFSNVETPVAYIDAEHCGNYARFCNHSCDNNADICEARVGTERMLVLKANKSIIPGEQICVDYGEDYFRQRQCLCGRETCKYPNLVNPVKSVTTPKPKKKNLRSKTPVSALGKRRTRNDEHDVCTTEPETKKTKSSEDSNSMPGLEFYLDPKTIPQGAPHQETLYHLEPTGPEVQESKVEISATSG
ncbi:SET domain-containing protein [Dothidotthia symphoricarpi CBS 119687]|uniref:SET domain-containing protein n=1 Tax=Dothidotthia symphoricarpi CBS 119687 TaxID=1392245 RepID=A0A6A6ANI4_9PLEO|nr:SET domain-containing protein [Dothidotthia symphoricarpi CBS 119687]KAF2132753.1 SET domain-containing protein [Dothidotthia symphoricarpi CBS 119687]